MLSSSTRRRTERADAHAETGDDATAIDRAKTARAVGGEHNAGAEAEDEGRQEEAHLAAKELAERVAEKRAEEAAALVGRDDVGADGGELLGRLGEEAKLLLERRQRDRRADERRVVAVAEGGMSVCG